MDNLCHTLVGVAFAQAGFKRKTALATATAAIAANLPDVDALVFLTDMPSVAFRRGITHGVPAQVILPMAFAWMMWTIGRKRPAATGVPVHLGWLIALSYIGILTHVWLDLLNTYGIRLLSPFSQQWFYGDTVFIIDIYLWLILGLGVLLAARAGSLRTGRLRVRPPGRRYARVALLLAAVYIGGMVLSARLARARVHDAWIESTGTPPTALMVGPLPGSLLRKNIIVDDGDRYVEGVFRWWPTGVTFDGDVTPKNDAIDAVAIARRDPTVSAFLIWSRFPFWQVRDVPGGVEVRVRDLRFKRGPAAGGFSAATVVSRP